jgi:hypothetical protein
VILNVKEMVMVMRKFRKRIKIFLTQNKTKLRMRAL